MKAFEEHWKAEEKELNDFLDKTFGPEKSDKGRVLRQNVLAESKQAAAGTWRAALEWMYNYLGYSEEDKRVKDIIQKEHDSE